MSRGGAILPATQGFYCDRTAKGTGLLPVKPEAEAFFTKHVLAHKDQRFPELCLADGTDVPCLTALLAGGTGPVGLWGTKDLQCFPDTSHTATDVKRLGEEQLGGQGCRRCRVASDSQHRGTKMPGLGFLLSMIKWAHLQRLYRMIRIPPRK